MKKLLATIVITLFLFGGAAGAFAAGDVVKIGYLRIVMSLPTFVAQEKGFFADEGLTVELIPFQSGTAIVDALVAGRIDANCGSAMTGHWFAAQAAPDRFKIFLVYGTTSAKDDNSFGVVVKKDSPLKRLKDLEGKKVGTFPGATSVALARATISRKLDPTKVTFTEVAPPNMIGALVSGQIDAFFSPEPMGQLAVYHGVGRYLIKSPLTLLKLKGGFPGMAFSFSSKFLKERPEDARKVKAAMYKAVDYIRGHEKNVRPYMTQYTNLQEPLAMSIPLDEFIKLDEFNKEAGQAMFDLLYEEGAYQQKIDTTTLYYEE